MTKQKRKPKYPYVALGGAKMDGYTKPKVDNIDLLDLQYPDDSLERLYVEDLLDSLSVEDLAEALAEINRVVKTDGVLLIVGKDCEKTGKISSDWIHTAENVLKLLSMVGFKAQLFPVDSGSLFDWPLSDRDSDRYVIAATMWRSQEELEELQRLLEERQRAQEQPEVVEGVVVNP